MTNIKENKMQLLVAQLKNPNGDDGIEVADMMYRTNLSMIKNAIDHFPNINQMNVLELGYGNGRHIDEIFKKYPTAQYIGLDISPLMHQYANENLAQSNYQNNTQFLHYDGRHIDFADDYFDVIFTVNTIYFWQSPKSFLKELSRVLNDNGILIITLIEKEFLLTVPFAQYGFTLYDKDAINQLIDDSNFVLMSYDSNREQVLSKTGEPVERLFSTCVLKTQ